MKIGVIAELLRKDLLLEDISYAAKLGAQGIQLYGKAGEGHIDFSSATDEELEQFSGYVKSKGLVISAICADVGGGSFQVESEWPARVALTNKITDAAAKIGVKVLTTHIGCVPDTKCDPTYAVMVKAVKAAADYAASKGCVLAIETGPELADVLKAFIEDVNSPGVGVNLDPANLRGVSAECPVYAVETLGKYIVHTHAKDAINTHTGSSAKFYGMRNPDGSAREITARASGFREVPLGEGQVPWKDYLAALKKIGYDGFLTIERECGETPARDIAKAVYFLKEKLIDTEA